MNMSRPFRDAICAVWSREAGGIVAHTRSMFSFN